MEQPKKTVTQPESEEIIHTIEADKVADIDGEDQIIIDEDNFVKITKEEFAFFKMMARDSGYLAFYVQNTVVKLIDSLPEKMKNANKRPSPFEIASVIPGLMKKMKEPIAEIVEHFPELRRICEQYSQLYTPPNRQVEDGKQ